MLDSMLNSMLTASTNGRCWDLDYSCIRRVSSMFDGAVRAGRVYLAFLVLHICEHWQSSGRTNLAADLSDNSVVQLVQTCLGNGMLDGAFRVRKARKQLPTTPLKE